jgi:hypothetical protein
MSAAQEALDSAEELDGYRAACAASPCNSHARKNQTYAPTFLENDDLKRLMHQFYSIPLMKDMDIIVMHSTADNGFPHTRPNALICMPKSSVIDSTDASLYETLCHEAYHVHQRRNPDLWSKKCLKEGWTPVEPPQSYVERCRINPDTFQQQRFWAWEKVHIPLPLFINEDYATLDGVIVKWLDTRNMVTYADPPSSFTARYGYSPTQPEHPYELLAVEYAGEKIIKQEQLLKKLQE